LSSGAGPWRRRPPVREAIHIVVLGPFWGTLIAFVAMAGVVPGGPSASAIAFFPIALLVGYAIGIGPALLTGILHYALGVRGRMRFLISPAIGSAASSLPMILVPQLARGGSANRGEAFVVGIVAVVGMLSTLISLVLTRSRFVEIPPLAAASQPDTPAQALPAAASRIAAAGAAGDRGAPGGAAAA
jgi:hypothetical protein